MCLPDRVVGSRVDVHPDEGGDRRGEEEGSAAGLGPEEIPERRLEAPRPRRPLRKGTAGFRALRHDGNLRRQVR